MTPLIDTKIYTLHRQSPSVFVEVIHSSLPPQNLVDHLTPSISWYVHSHVTFPYDCTTPLISLSVTFMWQEKWNPLVSQPMRGLRSQWSRPSVTSMNTPCRLNSVSLCGGGFLDLDFVVDDYGLRVSANHHLIIPLSVTPHLYFTDISRRAFNCFQDKRVGH